MRLIVSLILAIVMIACGNSTDKQEENLIKTDSIAIDTVNYEADYKATTILKPGAIVPDFSLSRLDGSIFKLSNQKGKMVFINFFALTCPICLKELPEMEKQIWQKYKDNADIVILCVGREESVEKLMAFRDKKQYSFPIAADTKRAIYALFAEKYIPRNIIIDKEGKLIYTEVGYNEEKFAKLINVLEESLN